MQTIAEKEDGANGHRSAFRSAQTVKILPMRTPGDARSAIYAVLFQGAKNNVAPRFSFCENKKWRNAGAAAMMEVLKSAPPRENIPGQQERPCHHILRLKDKARERVRVARPHLQKLEELGRRILADISENRRSGLSVLRGQGIRTR
jgi:hypothetical protein